MRSSALIAAVAILLSACGGGGGGGGSGFSSTPPPSGQGYPNTFPPSSLFKNLCANPRPGGSFPDTQGTRTDENNWLRSWSNELYLWYGEIVDEDPAAYSTPAYFELMKTFAITASGAPKDRFHFTIPTDEWLALSQSGISAGYGAEWVLVAAAPPRDIRVGFIDAGTPASSAGLTRGTRVLAINGEDVATSANVELLNAALFPSSAGESYTFTVQDPGAGSRDVTLTAEVITIDPVNVVSVLSTPTGDVGYLSFVDHIATSEAELIDAVTAFSAAAVTDLILDLRYNSGGFLDIANELAFMIAGPSAASGRVFDEIRFNDKHSVRNPVTGEVLEPDYFHSTSQGFSVPEGLPLPSLNLPRVYVLTSARTCSASETIINGLRGIDIEVIQIGTTTCGKPYGFYAFDNCGTSYFSIQFNGVNAKGFGDFTSGFSPENVRSVQGVEIPGCEVADDFDHALGEPAEGQLASALAYRDTGSCPLPPLAAAGTFTLGKPGDPQGAALTRRDRPGMVKR